MSQILKQSSAKCCWCQSALVQIASEPGIWWCLTPDCFRKQLAHGISRTVTEWDRVDGQHIPRNTSERLYIPTPKQATFAASRAKFRLYGGAAGGGKSVEGRRRLYKKALSLPGFEALILRETFPELERTHLRRMGEEVQWFGDQAEFIESKRLMKFQNGSLIECGHMDDERALQKYLSTEYDEILADEGSRFDPDRLLELSTRARSSKANVLAAGGPWFDVVSNPGGRASDMLKDLFILKEVPPDKYPILSGTDAEGRPYYNPDEWEFIKATLDDNPYLDPGYQRQLAVLQPWRYQQLRNGDWDVVAGAFFSRWDPSIHVRDVVIPDPREATWYRALDWGFHDPTVVGWFVVLPDGHYHCVAELKLVETVILDVVRAVAAMDRALGLPRPVSTVRTYADPATRQRAGQTGESIAETFGKCGMPLIPSVNERINGWMRVQALLKPARDGVPFLTVSPECKYLRRTFPAAVSDEQVPDDIDATCDDHGLDMVRYFAMSRPMPTLSAPRPRYGPDSVGALLDAAIEESSRLA
jgi:phage terminase large subunit